MSDVDQKTELYDEQQEEARAEQASNSDVLHEEARSDVADGDYIDEHYYGSDYYLVPPIASPLPPFGAQLPSPLPFLGEQPSASVSRKRKPQTTLSTITSQQADSVLGDEIGNSEEEEEGNSRLEEEQNSVTVVLSGTQVLLPCHRTFTCETYIRGTGNDPDEHDDLERFGASDITGQVTPPSGLYDDAGQVVLRSLASGPSSVVTTSMLMGRDRASKDRAAANKDKNKETKLFPQFENKMGSPKMTNMAWGEPAVVQTSAGLRYLAADDRAMVGRDAETRNITVTAPEYSYGTKSRFPRLSLIDSPRPHPFTNYRPLNHQLTKHAFTTHIVQRPRKAAEDGGDGAEQATPEKPTKKPAKKSKKKAVQAAPEPPVTDDEEDTSSPKGEEGEQIRQGTGLRLVLTAQLQAAAKSLEITVPPVQHAPPTTAVQSVLIAHPQRAPIEDTTDLTADDTANPTADHATEHVAEQLPEEPETPIQQRLLDMWTAAPESFQQAEDDLRTLLSNTISSGGWLLPALAEHGMLSEGFMHDLEPVIERGVIERQHWVDGVDQEVRIGLNRVATEVAMEDTWDLLHRVQQGDPVQEDGLRRGNAVQEDSLTLENMTLSERTVSQQDSPTRMANDKVPVVPSIREPKLD